MRSVTLKKAATVRDWDERGIPGLRSFKAGEVVTVSDRAHQALVAQGAVDPDSVATPVVPANDPPSPQAPKPAHPHYGKRGRR